MVFCRLEIVLYVNLNTLSTTLSTSVLVLVLAHFFCRCLCTLRLACSTKTTFFLSAQNLALLASFQAKLEQSPEEDEEDDDKEKMQKEDEEGDDTGW